MHIVPDFRRLIAVILIKLVAEHSRAALDLLLRRKLCQTAADKLAQLTGSALVLRNGFAALRYVHAVHLTACEFKADLCILTGERKSFGEIFLFQRHIFPAEQVRNRLQTELRNPQSGNLPGQIGLYCVLFQHISQFTSDKSIIRLLGLRRVGGGLLCGLLHHIRYSRSRCRRRVLQCGLDFADIDIVKGIVFGFLRLRFHLHLRCFQLFRFLHRDNVLAEPVIPAAETGLVQTCHDIFKRIAEISGICQHIGRIQQRRSVLHRVRLAQDTAEYLFNIHC